MFFNQHHMVSTDYEKLDSNAIELFTLLKLDLFGLLALTGF